jgi:hypothetical protein
MALIERVIGSDLARRGLPKLVELVSIKGCSVWYRISTGTQQVPFYLSDAIASSVVYLGAILFCHSYVVLQP